MAVRYAVKLDKVHEALGLKSGIRVNGWRLENPLDANARHHGTITNSKSELFIENPPEHQSRHKDHYSTKLVALLSNGGEKALVLKRFKDSAEPQSRIDWVRQNKSKLAVTGVTPVALIADREILIHPYQGGRKLTEDQQIDLLVKLDENGLASHNAIEHGHFRIDEKGIHLIPA